MQRVSKRYWGKPRTVRAAAINARPNREHWRLLNLQVMAVLGFVVLSSSLAHSQTILHVDSAASGPVHDGSSWCTAFRDLQDALDLARGSDEIRIAGGRYRPDRGTLDPREEFRLRDSIAIRGGYAGCQSINPDIRDARIYEVVLSGDLNGDDGPDFSGTAENSFHVIRTSGTGVTAILDGLTISGGNARGDTTSQTRGGGLQAVSGSRISVLDCRFVGNQASDDGGAVHVEGGAPVFSRCIFSGNRAGDDGGAARMGATAAVISNCEFRDNEAQGDGGGIYGRDSTLTITAARFEKNISHGDGGAISLFSQRLTLQDSSFSENSADGLGGAVWLETGILELKDCILTANHALRGGGVATSGADNVFTRAIFVRNEASFGGGLNAELSRGTLNDCTFNQNSVVDSGGALHIVQCDMSWDRLHANDNKALRDGGAVVLDNSTIQIVRAYFSGNLANDDGGAFSALASTVAVVGSQFLANVANDNGGAARLDGSELQFVNSMFVGNESGGSGGAIEGMGGSLGIANCTLVANFAETVGGVAWDAGDVGIQNSILWRNQDASGVGVDAELGDIGLPAIRRSCVTGWGARGGDGVIDDDPKFIAVPGRDQLPGTADDNLRLGPGSPCINAGDNALLPLDILDLDQDGNVSESMPVDADDRNRVYGMAVDLGAWEFICIDDRGCDDGRYCTGTEHCSNGACVSGHSPCGSRVCSEDLQQCVQCLTDQNCDDGRFCNGPERCVSYRCESRAAPCINRICDEAGESCAACLANSDCDDRDECTIDRCVDGSCQFADAPSCADADADGVADASDHCPDTLSEAAVDENGCSCSQFDDDEDGISNCVDECPGTVMPDETGPAIGPNGCVESQVDRDNDGIPDDLDFCPGSRAGAIVDATGCSHSDDPEGSMIPDDGAPRPSPNLCGAIGTVFMFMASGMFMACLVYANKLRRLTHDIRPNALSKP